jgi:GntR family transcriptional repressor for pyruvate dehydrogenase complex
MFMLLDDPQRFLVHDIRFHRAVARASRNPVLAALMEMVAELFYDQRKETVDRWKGAHQASEHHRRIYQAIRARDPERAKAEMDAHLRWAQEDQRQENLDSNPERAGEQGPDQGEGE